MPRLPEQIKMAMARPRLTLTPATAFAAACGWKEAMPAPPSDTMASSPL